MGRFLLKSLLLSGVVATVYVAMAARVDMAPAIQNQNYKLRHMRHREPVETLIMGDSRALAMNRFGEKGAYNYAMTYYYGMGFYPYLLRRYLKANPPPKVIILSFIPESLCEKQDYAVSPTSARVFSFRDLLKDPKLRKDRKKLKEMLLNRFDINRYYANPYDRSLFDPQTGFLIFRRDFHYKKTFLLVPDDRFRITDVSLEYLREFLDLAQANHIQVIIYFMPISEMAHRIPQFYDEFSRKIKEVAAQFPWAYFVRPYSKEDLYPLDYTIDGTHLNDKGALHFNGTRFKNLMQWSAALASSTRSPTAPSFQEFPFSPSFIRPPVLAKAVDPASR